MVRLQLLTFSTICQWCNASRVLLLQKVGRLTPYSFKTPRIIGFILQRLLLRKRWTRRAIFINLTAVKEIELTFFDNRLHVARTSRCIRHGKEDFDGYR